MQGWLSSLLLLALAGTAGAGGFALKSPDFGKGGTLAMRQVYDGYGCSGGNVSPALTWENPPAGTKSFGLLLFDPDAAKGKGWWHWLVIDIPATARELPSGSGDAGGRALPAGAVQLRNSFGSNSFGGACPPVGDAPHHYVFTLYALDVERIALAPDAPGPEVRIALERHAVAKAEITARYGR